MVGWRGAYKECASLGGGGGGGAGKGYLQIVVHIPSFRHRRPQRQVQLPRRVQRPRGVSREAWQAAAARERVGADRRQRRRLRQAVRRALSKAFKRNMNVRLLSVERLINATIKQVGQLAGRQAGRQQLINWLQNYYASMGQLIDRNSETGNATRVQMHWHISQVSDRAWSCHTAL